MALQYKLPKQEPRDLPLSESSSTQTAKEFIRNECQIIVPFKLRVYIKGEARYLKPEQTLGEVFAMGGAVLNVNYTEAADKQRDRRKQAKATADLVRADVEREGLKNREHTTAETNRLISAFSPQFGPGEENATANQLRQRKAAAAERFDEMIKKAAEKEASIRKFSPSELRGKLAAIGAATHGTKAVLVRRLLNAAAPAPQAAGAGSSTGANAGAGSEVAYAHQEGKAEKQSKAAEAKRQQNDSLLARVDAGDATDLETLQVQQKKTQLLIRVAKEKMKQNKASGLKCAACGSLEGEMKPYIGSGFLGNCCAELRMTEEELQHDLQNCLAQNFLEPAEADGILGFCKDKLPESKRIILPRFKVASLQSSKIMCADVDENDEHPQYEFANMDEHNYGMRQSSITGTALQPLCQKIAAVYFAGAEQRFHIVINCHADGKAYTPSHRDQPMSLQSKSSVFETHASVYVFSVGASRLFSFFKDLGQKGNTGLKARGNLEVLYDIKTAHNTLAHMSGKVNAACLHAVWPDPSTNAGDDTLRFGVTVRVAERLFVNTLRGEYRIYKHGAWETKKLPALSDDVPAQAPEQDGVAPAKKQRLEEDGEASTSAVASSPASSLSAGVARPEGRENARGKSV